MGRGSDTRLDKSNQIQLSEWGTVDATTDTSFTLFVSIRIDYDYAVARDLMREEGYWAAETPDFSTKEVIILDLTTVPEETILSLVPVFVGLGLVGWLRKRKK